MLIFASVGKVAHVDFSELHNKTQSSANFSLHLTHRRSTKWWAPWSWWRWTRTVWHQSSGWTRSSAKWIRTTTIRSRWRSSKRRQRATRPSCSSCSVTCRSEPSPLARLPVCNPHTLDSSTCFNVSLGSLPFPQEKKKTMLGLFFNGLASCGCMHENVKCWIILNIAIRYHTFLSQNMPMWFVHSNPKHPQSTLACISVEHCIQLCSCSI